jgi:hypothetical protein
MVGIAQGNHSYGNTSSNSNRAFGRLGYFDYFSISTTPI